MFRNVLKRLVTGTTRVHRYAESAAVTQRTTVASVWTRSLSDVADEVSQPFDSFLQKVLVCPLSKKPLRYEAATNELINEELGIAYPIIGGIPCMIPQEARLIQKDAEPSTPPAEQ